MKKTLRALFIILFYLYIPLQVSAEEQVIPVSMEMTYYTDYGTCASGVETRAGICAASRKYMGMTAVIYEDNNGMPGELVGIYEVMDTGYGRPTGQKDIDGNSLGTIEAGLCIDVFFENGKDGSSFIKEHGNKVFVFFLQAEG